MISIEKPIVECIKKDEEKSSASFAIYPLQKGYGTTLGNSLRRLLISSLPGVAVYYIRIDGVLHEFSTIEGVREDVVDIILNLKSLIAVIHSDDEEKVIRIEKNEPGEITAGDLITDIDVEILNTDLYIATLEKGGSISMEIGLKRGVGYVPSEEHDKDNLPIGTVLVDSIFSPARTVNWHSEIIREGENTLLDKLIIDVSTDGSISPGESLSLAAKIMNEHLNLLIEMSDDIDKLEIMVEKEEDKFEKVLEMTIEDLDLSVRSYNCLKRASINTVDELINKSEADMMKVRNLGKKSLDEVKKKLEELELSLKSDDE